MSGDCRKKGMLKRKEGNGRGPSRGKRDSMSENCEIEMLAGGWARMWD